MVARLIVTMVALLALFLPACEDIEPSAPLTLEPTTTQPEAPPEVPPEEAPQPIEGDGNLFRE